MPNRIAIYAGLLTALGAFLTALLGAFDSDTAKAVVAGVALLVVGAIVVTYLIGWQHYEERTDLERLIPDERLGRESDLPG